MESYEYIEQAVSQIRAKKARDMVAKELTAHIEDQTESYLNQGMARDEAVREAVRQMGDPVEVGISLDKIHRPQTDHKMIVMLAAVCLLGILLQAAVCSQISMARTSVLHCIPRSAVLLLAVCIAAALLVCMVDYTVSLKYAPFHMAVLLLLFWAACLFILPSKNGGHLYMRGCLYLFVPLYGRALYLLRGTGMGGYAGGILLSCGLVLATAPLVGAGVCLHFLFVTAIMLTFAVFCGWFGEKKRLMLSVLWGGGIAGSCLMIGWTLHRGNFTAKRILATLHPEDYADTYGYYVMTMRGWLSQARLWGNPLAADSFTEVLMTGGIGNGFFGCWQSNLLYLLLRYGIVAGVIVMSGYLFCIGYFLYKCVTQKNQLGKVIGAGCCFAFLTEAVGYALSNFGVVPGSSQLPFLSYDGVSTVVWAVLSGYVFSIVRYQNLIPADKTASRKRYRFRLRLEKVEW